MLFLLNLDNLVNEVGSGGVIVSGTYSDTSGGIVANSSSSVQYTANIIIVTNDLTCEEGFATVQYITDASTSGGALLGGTVQLNFTADGGITISGGSVYGVTSYIYLGQGGEIQICGKPSYSKTIFIYTTYGPGDIVFNKKKALNGKIEKVCIKDVIIGTIPKGCSSSGAGSYPIYKDTYNGIWLEEDIVDQEAALFLINFYLETQAQNLLDIECNL